MATRTVAESREERKRELETAKEEMRSAVARYAAAKLAAANATDVESHPALLDERIRRNVGTSARAGGGVPGRPLGGRGGERAAV